MDQPELSSIEECQAGRLSAFDNLYTLHVDAIYKFLHRRTLVREIAEDLTSVTFLKAMESIRSFDPERGPFRAWLYRIARNTLIDHYRRGSSHTVDIESVWDLPSEDSASELAEQSIDARKLHEGLQRLKPAQRQIVLLRVWEGLSYKEIAEITGKSENTCKVTFSRAVSELRAHLPSLLLLLLFIPAKLASEAGFPSIP